jgi:hypothetical protein
MISEGVRQFTPPPWEGRLPAIACDFKWTNYSSQRQKHVWPQICNSGATKRIFTTSPSRLILELSSGDSMELSSCANRLGTGDRQGHSTKDLQWLALTWTERGVGLDGTMALDGQWLWTDNGLDGQWLWTDNGLDGPVLR